MKRGIDRLLSEGKGKQLMWLLLLSAGVVAVVLFISHVLFDKLKWQQVISVFLDPGCFNGSPEGSEWLLLPLAFFSLVILSGLMVSTFTNVVENISDSVRAGERRYKFKNHVLVIGAGKQLAPMLSALAGDERNIVVMSEARPDVDGNYTYYCGRRDSVADLRSARPAHASIIYIIGEDNEPDHDARNLRAVDILKQLTAEAEREIQCYMTLEDRTSSEVYEYLHLPVQGKLLLVDVINVYEYMAERLMVESDFLPTIKQGDSRRSHIVIYGTGKVAHNVANTAAHISHYANYVESGVKTCITFVGCGMKRYMDSIIASRPSLFELSVYRYIDSDGKIEEHRPEKDFLDVEWEFVDTYDTSKLSRDMLRRICASSDEILTVVVAEENPAVATATALHLPREVYDSKIAVYLEESAEILELSRKTKMFGDITIFGAASVPLSDPLFRLRALRGQRVNFVYDQAYVKSGSIEEAWYRLSESDKYSSIYCAMAMPMRLRCYDMDGDRLPIYEAEHRRWMMSMLIMGYKPGERRDKARFVHNDICPFDELEPEEQDKDKILIDAMPEILA